MLLLRNFFSIILITSLLQSCGFTPVYKGNIQENEEGAGNGELLKEKLASISLKSVKFGRAGQVLQTSLEDILNPISIQVDKKYDLKLKIDKRRVAQAIERDREITRYNLIVMVQYTLMESSTGKVVSSGVSRIEDSYDAVQSDFATFAVEEDTLLRIMKEVAQDIRFRLVSFLINTAKAPDVAVATK